MVSRVAIHFGAWRYSRGIAKFLHKYRKTGSIGRRIGSVRPSKVTREVKRVVDEQMRLDRW